MTPPNFSYLVEGQIAGCGLPGQFRDLAQELKELKAEGIRAIVSAREHPLDQAQVQEAGMAYLHLEVRDYTAPTLAQFEQFRDFVRRELDHGGGAVVVHCRAGIGRTGTFLASWLIAEGADAETAIRTVRRRRPGSIETREQVQALSAWQEHLRPNSD